MTEVRATIVRFVVCEPETSIAATLWIAFTWVIDHVQVAPLAIITAPEKRCGKTQLLELIGRLSKRALFAANISSAATFRVIEAKAPTLLIDEANSFFARMKNYVASLILGIRAQALMSSALLATISR